MLLLDALLQGMPLGGFRRNLLVLLESENGGSEWLSTRCHGPSCLASCLGGSLLLLLLLLLL